ncbi:MAG: SUF system Fe-S cluster assembly regulator [Xanthomonadales bacterium]|nr:SUF system Fe-S cluster assembly regulator [Gammaproteobacteria bacterium]MBT8073671.1 SUF system Fe-S cluster assembly regulator [Gammaproteobacteria bacterium]NNK04515.1 SUF system Fe-S cluster assembly regulator [Xanthomonadales bacterium]NNK97943.1 SUF system Fe-S cluster assembly regulator [Xanthomonadales bacterium]
MLRISKMTDYAIMVMVELHGLRGEVLSAHALAERSHLELPTVSKVLKLLVKTDLVASYRGPSGGYSLERDAEEISVAEIIAAIEGPIAMTECSVEEGLCAQEAVCGLRGNWQRISLAIAKAMEAVSLAEMAQPVKTPAAPLHITTFNA